VKKRAVPISDGLVETLSSFGTGMKAKMSIFISILRQILGCSPVIKEEFTSFCSDSEIDISYIQIN